MILNESKSKRQQEGAEKWKNSKAYGSPKNGCGILWYVTGFGKTYTSLEYICKPYIKFDETRSIIILTCRESHYNEWVKNSPQILGEYNNNICVYTVQYLIEHKKSLTCDLLIVDEIHKFYEDVFFSYIDGTNIEWNHFLGLTATLKDPQGRHSKLWKFTAVCDHIPEDVALENGWISKYVEYNLGVELTAKEIEKYKEAEEMIASYGAMFEDPIDDKLGNKMGSSGETIFFKANRCLQGGKSAADGKEYSAYQYALYWARQNGWHDKLNLSNQKQKEIDDIWNPYKIIGYAKKYMKGIRDRKEILYNAEQKIEVIKQLVAKFSELKTICFSESTVFADTVTDALNENRKIPIAVTYHTSMESTYLKDDKGEWITHKNGNKKKFGITGLKKIALELFSKGKRMFMSTARALDEAFDQPDVRMGIIASRSSNPNQQTQRGGRVKRVIPEEPDSIMLLVNLYVRGTRDLDYLMSSQSHNTQNKHWVTSVEEIEFEPTIQSFDLDDL